MVLVGMGRCSECGGECGDVGPESLSQSDRRSAGSVELLAEVVLLEEKLHCRSLHASSRSVVLALDADRVPHGRAMRAKCFSAKLPECFSAKLSESICRKMTGTATVSDIFICFDSRAQNEDTCDCPLGDSTQLAALVSSHSRFRFESFLSKSWLLRRAASVRSKLEGECGVFTGNITLPKGVSQHGDCTPVGEDSVKSNKGDSVSDGLLRIGEEEHLTSLTLGQFCGGGRCGDDTGTAGRATTTSLPLARLAVTVD